LVHEHFGVNVIIDLVKPGTLPKTSSGKLSRFQSRQAFLERHSNPTLELPGPQLQERKTA
jgi:acyl-coenzyme A synthetase/AMP-(fatty) acid ligase